MKKIILFAFMGLISTNLFSQMEKGSFTFLLDGHYMKTSSSTGVSTNYSATDGNYTSFAPSVAYGLTNHLTVGIGADYERDKEERYNHLYFNHFAQAEMMNIKSKALLPSLYLGYHHPIANRLFIGSTMKFSYGKIKSSYQTTYAGMEELTIIDELQEGSVNYSRSIGSEAETDYFRVKLYPELTYFLGQRFGLSLGLGGMEYSLYDWEQDTSDWQVNFDPTYWRLGFKLNL
ncbi:hypothetical protein [Gaoshiqia sp. Z1-71]|uniref:hypothetical protein n=1 Tax=Gaoshiqia hydrogeniformans TaxID=3290090 RepID=UPI003BF79C34